MRFWKGFGHILTLKHTPRFCALHKCARKMRSRKTLITLEKHLFVDICIPHAQRRSTVYRYPIILSHWTCSELSVIFFVVFQIILLDLSFYRTFNSRSRVISFFFPLMKAIQKIVSLANCFNKTKNKYLGTGHIQWDWWTISTINPKIWQSIDVCILFVKLFLELFEVQNA